MKRFLLTISIAFVAVVLFIPTTSTCAEQQREQRPNIVMILADDLGYGDLSCYGATKVQTPNIDRLAEQGMRFTDTHSPHAVCTPTRYALLTGRYAWRTWVKHRCVWSDDPLLIDTNRLTLPKLLQSADYQTACIGKWHLGFGSPESAGWDPQKGPDYNRPLKPGPLECGFDYFFGIPHVGQHPHVLIENHRIVGHDPEDPIEIKLDPRNRTRSSYLDRQNVTPWHEFTGGEAALYQHENLAVRLTEKSVDWIEQQQQGPFFLYFAPRNVHSPLKPHPRFAGKSKIGVYGDFILELDWSVGEILKALERKGFADNTLVLFSSDNGGVQKGHRPAHVVDYDGHKANGPLRGQKTEVYEGGHRVPLIARWPEKIQAGTENDALVALLDVMHTTAALVGKSLPDDAAPDDAAPDGYSFLHELVGGTAAGPVRSQLVMNANDDNGYWAVRQGDWKLILGRHGGGSIGPPHSVDQSSPPGQLYDLSSDLGESENLYEQRPEIVRRLAALLAQVRDTDSDQSRSGDSADEGEVGEFSIPEVSPLDPRQLLAIRRLVKENSEAAALAAEARRLALPLFDKQPQPLKEIHYEGLVNTDPKRIAAVAKLKDMADVARMLRHWQTSGDEKAAEMLRRYILAWSETYEITGNDVNENKFHPLLSSYYSLRPEFSKANRERVDEWIEQLGEQHARALRRSQHFTNRYTKHIRLTAVCGKILEREEWIELAVDGIRRFVTKSLNSDGTSLDLERRDALGYHVSALRPPLELAMLLGPRGRELYRWESSAGGSLKNSVDYTVPYSMGEKVHQEWVNTKVDLDKRRAAAGLEKYQPGREFDPHDSIKLMETAAFFDPSLMKVVAHLIEDDAKHFPTWQTLVNAAAATASDHNDK